MCDPLMPAAAASHEPMRYIVAVFAVLFNDRAEFLSLRCTDARFAGKWHLPAGRLEAGETWKEGLFREIEEETGLEEHDVQIRDPIHVHNWTLDGEPYLGVAFWGTVARTKIALSTEHDQYRWVSEEGLPDLVPAYDDFPDIVRAAYRRAAEGSRGKP